VKFKISKDTDGLIKHFYPILPYKVMFKYLDTGDKSTCLMNNRIYTGVPELADQIETVYSLMVMKVKNV
jgi:hypothetical protein